MKARLSLLLGLGLILAACESTDECDADASKKIDAAGAAGGAGSNEEFKKNVKDRVYFHFNKHDLTPRARKVLEEQAAWLKTHSASHAEIAGHCDKRGTREYNMALGEHRAAAAKDALTEMGVGADRLTTKSYGKEQPLDEGNNEKAHAKNRVAITEVR